MEPSGVVQLPVLWSTEAEDEDDGGGGAEGDEVRPSGMLGSLPF